MSNSAYQNYLTELQNFVDAIGNDSAQDKSDSYSGPRDSNGQPNGIGKMIYDGGSVFEGQFLHGLKNGKGIQTWASGGKYEGDWKNGKQDGKGSYSWLDGDKYDGEWKDGKMEGKGIFSRSIGDKYEGEWKGDKKDGKGIYTWPRGDKYEGEWKNNKKDGKGIQTWASGNKYDGEWKDGNMHGTGIRTWPSGDKYEGEWKDDKKDGKGILTFANGKKLTGIWKGNIRMTGEFVWNNHPGFTFLFEQASGQDNIIIAKCKKIGSERFYKYDQLVFENVEVKSDLTIKGKVLVPGQGWQDFEGTVVENQIIIYIGEPRWHWSFKLVD